MQAIVALKQVEFHLTVPENQDTSMMLMEMLIWNANQFIVAIIDLKYETYSKTTSAILQQYFNVYQQLFSMAVDETADLALAKWFDI